MSKFTYKKLDGCYDTFAVSKERYNKAEAIELFCKENKIKNRVVSVGSAFIKYQTITRTKTEVINDWVIINEFKTGSCPCWLLHTHTTRLPKSKEKNYRLYQVKNGIAKIEGIN